MLNIPEFTAINQEQNEYYYRFTVERNETPYMCTNYGWIKSEHDMEFNSFDFRNEQEFNAYYEEVKDEFIYTGVDLTTLSKILEEGEF